MNACKEGLPNAKYNILKWQKMEWWLVVSVHDKYDPLGVTTRYVVFDDMIAQKLDYVVHKVYLTDYSLSN